MKYIGRRLLHNVLLVCGVSLFAFFLAASAPGDFTDTLRLDPSISQQTLAAQRARFGLNESLPRRYFDWLGHVVRGDLGYSVAYDAPVASLLWPRMRNTLALTLIATLLAWSIAIPLGAWGAARPHGLGRFLCGGTAGLLAIPDILLALLFLLFAARTGWLPTGGMLSVGFENFSFWGKVQDAARHMFLPVVALVLGALPILVAHVRAAVADAFETPFYRAARAHGIHRRQLFLRYALPMAANPLISLFGLSLASLLSASLLVEVIMGWPGLGPLILNAVEARDAQVVVATALASTLFLLAGNWISDVLLYFHDPRIRAE
jgi:peptide/nickel transport system permease protein